jgi:hypothetical protein
VAPLLFCAPVAPFGISAVWHLALSGISRRLASGAPYALRRSGPAPFSSLKSTLTMKPVG